MKSKIILFPFLLLVSIQSKLNAQIFNSNPSITNKVIYLDFDGQKVSGTLWNNGNTINAAPSTASAANKKVIWQRVSEDYRPFNVNVTTDSTRFNNALPTSRIRLVFTPTSSWYGSAGGVAYLGSFNWGGYPGTPAWIFENQLGYNAKSMAEAASHETGHTLSLMHQSTYSSATCSKTAEYNPGQGSGVTSWAPIMGVGYSKNVTIWHNGPNATGCNVLQFDHGNGAPGITGSSFLSFLPDDVGNTTATGKILNLNNINLSDSGIITTPTDIDLYNFTICNSRYVSVNVKPWALDTTPGSYAGANLDVKLKLFNAAGTMLAADSSLSKLNGLLGMTLAPGAYYFTVDGGSSSNYSDYGSIGKYYVGVKATNPPQLANTIVTPTNFCSGQNTVLTYSSNGSPNTWQWTIAGPTSTTSAIGNPTFNFSPAGIYTITLLATGTTSTSCPVTTTVDVGSLPVMSVLGTNTVLCPQKSGSLSATGATSYTWLPGGSVGVSLLTTPNVNTTYTVIGNNGTCINSAVSTLSVSPGFNVNLSASNNTICLGASVTITASGASTYTFNPGNITTNPAVLSPTFNTNFTVTANSNGCLKTGLILVKVTPVTDLTVTATETLVCAFQSLTITANGALNYTYNPGGLTGNPIVLTPSVPTIYTVTGADANNCLSDTTVEVLIDICASVSSIKGNASKSIRMFPNPASTQFIIETDGGNYLTEIYDSVGALVYSVNSGEKKNIYVDTQNWGKGIYLVRMYSGDKVVAEQKMVLH
ncbi:MAG: T9SS type A sorting domain-containing protein [Bacteroidia bacterium]|nr:T9SS type A sorting domain-containing protein [Bacteroidia bacterium]